MVRNLLVVLATIVTCASAAADPGINLVDWNKPRTEDEARLLPGLLLGKRIFEDQNLSEPRGLSCASCHDPATAYRGNNHSGIPAIPAGSRSGIFGNRKSPSILYQAYSPPFSFAERLNDVTGEPEIVPVGGQFWDGRASGLEEQVEGPLLNPREMNNPSKESVVSKARAGPYADLAREVYGANVFKDDRAFEKLASAVASYEASPRFKPFSSKFDQWLEGRTLLSDQEWKGFQVFVDRKKGNCLSCHDGGGVDEHEGSAAVASAKGPTDMSQLSRNPRSWLFTDFTYDVLGAPRNRAIPENADPTHFDLGLCARSDLRSLAPADYDLESLCGAFKVPSLRNVAVGGPYLHNGAFTKLRDVVAFYFTRDTDPGRWFPKNADGAVEKFDDLPERYRHNVNVRQIPYDRKAGEEPRATDDEIDALVAFLKTLTDEPFKNAD